MKPVVIFVSDSPELKAEMSEDPTIRSVVSSEDFDSIDTGRVSRVVIDAPSIPPERRSMVLKRLRDESEHRDLSVAVVGPLPSVSGISDWLANSVTPHLLPPCTGLERGRFQKMLQAYIADRPPSVHPETNVDFTWNIRSSRSTEALLQRLTDVCAGKINRDRVILSITSATMELIVNALYHAPIDEHGHRPFSQTQRTEHVEWDADKSIEVSVSVTDKSCRIVVEDPFGSLHPDTLRKYLSRCMQDTSPTALEDSAGAGLGIYSAMMYSTSLDYDIVRGQRTRATLGFEDVHSFREFSSRAKSFSCFFSDSE